MKRTASVRAAAAAQRRAGGPPASPMSTGLPRDRAWRNPVEPVSRLRQGRSLPPPAISASVAITPGRRRRDGEAIPGRFRARQHFRHAEAPWWSRRAVSARASWRRHDVGSTGAPVRVGRPTPFGRPARLHGDDRLVARGGPRAGMNGRDGADRVGWRGYRGRPHIVQHVAEIDVAVAERYNARSPRRAGAQSYGAASRPIAL